MAEISKFDILMSEVTSGQLEGKMDEIINRMEEVLQDEDMGTMDEMMTDLRNYLSSKEKLDEYLDAEGTMKVSFETVFSWFKTSIEKKREGLR